MADYDFSRMNSRSFEQLAQALSIPVLGTGTAIFGDGPDGGREATFEGKLNYPSPADRWDGYVVMQAKFLQKPKNNASDVAWLEQQLRTEFDKFNDKSKKLRRPEYYIIVTNVNLSRSDAKIEFQDWSRA
jgi:hypothetical protein